MTPIAGGALYATWAAHMGVTVPWEDVSTRERWAWWAVSNQAYLRAAEGEDCDHVDDNGRLYTNDEWLERRERKREET